MPYVPGAFVHGVRHIADVYRSSNVFTNNVPTALWDQPGPTSAIVGGIYIPDNPFRIEFAQTLLSETGANAANDDGEGTDVPDIPDDSLESTTSTSVAESVAVDRGRPVTDTFSEKFDYNQKLSTNFAVKDLSVNTIFPHNIVAQNGLSIADILSNMQGVAINILEPLRAQYPGLRINSAFRKGTGTSQHNKGQAVDIQWPGLAAAGYTPIAQWITANLPVDQLIFEHGNSIWLHISYNRTLTSQRGILLTYYPKVTPNYQPGLTNYYA
jgi:hypothetical protein